MQLADVFGNNINDAAAAGQVSVIAVAVAGTAVPLLLKTSESTDLDVDSAALGPTRSSTKPSALIFVGRMERTGLYSLQVCLPRGTSQLLRCCSLGRCSLTQCCCHFHAGPAVHAIACSAAVYVTGDHRIAC